jgi:nucleotide-binding universal stress UspA family protein
MYQHLLIATDGSELANKAIEHGIALAKALGSKITIVTVTEPWHTFAAGEATVAFPIEEYETSTEKAAQQTLAKSASKVDDAGLKCETVHIKDSYPADGILEAAKDGGCDLIVMASHGRRGLTRMLLGSQANHVVTHSSLPVLICR